MAGSPTLILLAVDRVVEVVSNRGEVWGSDKPFSSQSSTQTVVTHPSRRSSCSADLGSMQDSKRDGSNVWSGNRAT